MNLWASAEMQTNAHQKPREIQKIQTCKPHGPSIRHQAFRHGVCSFGFFCFFGKLEVFDMLQPELQKTSRNPNNPKLQAPWTIHQTSGLQTWSVKSWIFWIFSISRNSWELFKKTYFSIFESLNWGLDSNKSLSIFESLNLRIQVLRANLFAPIFFFIQRS